MSNQTIIQSIGQELGRNLVARHQINGTINMVDVLKEASYCLAVNTIITQRQLLQRTGGTMQFVPTETIEIMLEGINKLLTHLFPNEFKEQHLQMLEKDFESLMGTKNVENIINNHYNDLYGYEGGNVL